jgi:hypothetical protein
VKYGVDVASCGMICIPSFMKTDAAIQARFLPSKFDRL